MKKITILAVLFCAVINMFSQEKELNIGINGGFTIGNIEPQSSIAFGADANYLFDWYEDFKVGPTIGVTYFLPKEENGVKPDARMYIPIGASIRFQSIDDAFFIGGELGYAIGITPSGDKGGIFFKPMVGYNVSESIKLNLFYAGVKKRQPTFGYIGLGLSFDILNQNNMGYYSY